MRNSTKRIIALGTPIAAVAATGIAFAAWTADGTGTGTASAGTAAAVTISQTAVTGLYPTDSLSNVDVTVSNTNPFKVQLSTLSLSSVTVSSAPKDTGQTKTCTDSEATADITSTGLALGTATDVVAGTTGAATTKEYSNFPLSVSNNLPDTCQGASFVLHYAVGAQSAS